MLTSLRIHRMSRGIKLIDLAKRIGISVSFLSRIERGKAYGTKSTRRKIADALQITEDNF